MHEMKPNARRGMIVFAGQAGQDAVLIHFPRTGPVRWCADSSFAGRAGQDGVLVHFPWAGLVNFLRRNLL